MEAGQGSVPDTRTPGNGDSTLKMSASTLSLSNAATKEQSSRGWSTGDVRSRLDNDGRLDADNVAQSLLLDARSRFDELESEDRALESFDIDASAFAPAHLTALAPLATRLVDLCLYNCFNICVVDLSPLLAASLGHGSLRSLSLTLSCGDVDGLFTTVAACCPNLEELQVWRSVDDMDMERWDVQAEAIDMMLEKVVSLRTLAVESMRFVDEFDKTETKIDPEPSGARLRGLSMVDCEFSRTFFTSICRGRALRYLEVVGSAGSTSWEDGEGEVETMIGGAILAVAGEMCGETLTSLGICGLELRDHDVKGISLYFKNLKRVSLGDFSMGLTGKAMNYLAKVKNLQLLHLLSDGFTATDTWGREEGDEPGISDNDLDGLDGIRDLILVGIKGVTPDGIRMHMSQVTDVGVSGCDGWSNPQQVCRLCRANEDVVIRVVQGANLLSNGTFQAAFWDCK